MGSKESCCHFCRQTTTCTQAITHDHTLSHSITHSIATALTHILLPSQRPHQHRRTNTQCAIALLLVYLFCSLQLPLASEACGAHNVCSLVRANDNFAHSEHCSRLVWPGGKWYFMSLLLRCLTCVAYLLCLSTAPGLGMETAFHACRMLAAEMIHFVNQIQYFLLFEVLESAWVQLTAALADVVGFDQILQAHERFLLTLMERMFLMPASQVKRTGDKRKGRTNRRRQGVNGTYHVCSVYQPRVPCLPPSCPSQTILSQLRSIFDLIAQFKLIQVSLGRPTGVDDERRGS